MPAASEKGNGSITIYITHRFAPMPHLVHPWYCIAMWCLHLGTLRLLEYFLQLHLLPCKWVLQTTLCHLYFWYSIDSSHISHGHYFIYRIKVLSTAIQEHVFILMYLLVEIFKSISMISRYILCYFLTTTSFWCTFQVTKCKFYIIQFYLVLHILNMYHICTLHFYVMLCLNLYISLT